MHAAALLGGGRKWDGGLRLRLIEKARPVSKLGGLRAAVNRRRGKKRKGSPALVECQYVVVKVKSEARECVGVKQ